eukprot:SAG11_NODE_22054_length_413_cov_0.662420_2_plen_84_part_01
MQQGVCSCRRWSLPHLQLLVPVRSLIIYTFVFGTPIYSFSVAFCLVKQSFGVWDIDDLLLIGHATSFSINVLCRRHFRPDLPTA